MPSGLTSAGSAELATDAPIGLQGLRNQQRGRPASLSAD